jgi:hypothetical protein
VRVKFAPGFCTKGKEKWRSLSEAVPSIGAKWSWATKPKTTQLAGKETTVRTIRNLFRIAQSLVEAAC